MAVYTELTQQDIERICTAYGVRAESFSTIDGGSSNTNCRVDGEAAGTGPGSFILTLFESLPREQVQRVARLLELLQKSDIPTNRLLLQQNGEPVGEYLGKPILIKDCIAGEVLRPGDAVLREAGAAMAKLHAVPAPDFLPEQHLYRRETIPAVLQNDNTDTFARDLEQRLQELRADLHEGIADDLPRGLIHGDLFYDNMLIADGRLRAILDFEEACHERLVFDLGMAILGLCTDDSTPDLNRARVFLEGYRRLREPTAREKAALKAFTEYAALGTAAWRYWKFRIDTPTAAKRDRHEQMLACARAYQEIPAPEFTRAVFG